MSRIVTVLVTLLFTTVLFAHPWKPTHYVIIDTDAGIDDIRAISMLLASPDVRVMGIIASGGAVPAETAYVKIRSLLNRYHHEGLPVAINRNSPAATPTLPIPASMIYGDEQNIDPSVAEDHLSLISRLLEHESSKVKFVALGSLNSASSALQSVPLLHERLTEIVWSSSGTGENPGFNYSLDAKSAEEILSGTVKVSAIGPTTGPVKYNGALISMISEAGTRYSQLVSEILHSPAAAGHSFITNLTDEMVPLYLHYPGLFGECEEVDGIITLTADHDKLNEHFIKIVTGETVEKNQVIRAIPTDPEFYFEDLAPHVTDIIRRHGLEEWTAGVLTNELHRHLGVYAIVGVKMGIRAREYFNTGVDEFFITAHAGHRQPLSCLIDGLMTSTGSTPGHALLSVPETDQPEASATIEYKDMAIKITLRPHIAEMIAAELQEFNFVYGLDSNTYWELVRVNAIRYWRDFDRRDIFIIETL